MKKVVFIIVMLITSFSISKADWVNKGHYFEMDSTYGEIKDYKISDEGQIWAVNSQNEILNIDFTTGKLIKRFKCEVNPNLNSFKVSKDAQSTIFVHYVMPNGVPTIIDVNLKIYNNSNNNIELNTIVKVELKGIGETDGFNVIDVDYSIKSKLLLLNLNYSAGGYLGDGLSGGGEYNNFIIFDTKNNLKVLDLNYAFESYNINLSEELKDIYFIGNEYSTQTDNSGTDYTSSRSTSYFYKYNVKDKKEDKLFTFSHSTFTELNGGNSSKSGDPSDFIQLLQPTNDSLLYLIFHNRLNSNDTILYAYDKFTKKYIDSITIKENSRDYTNFKLDNKDFLHIINGKTYFIKLISNNLITLDSLYFPENVYNNQFFKNGEQTFVFFTDNKSKLNYFTTENLKNIPNIGFEANLTTTLKKKKITFYSTATPVDLEFEWEVEPGVKIKTNINYLEYSYQNIGVYDIKLKIIDKQGKEYYFEKLKYITINEELIADFDYSFDQFTRNCYFTSKTTGTITSYQWDFGDNSKSNDTNPIHFYTIDGEYLVKLIISNGIDMDTISKSINISSNGYLKINKEFTKTFKLDTIIKPEQYFITNGILKVFSYDNNYYYYPKDRWREAYYELNYKFVIYNFDFLNTKSEIVHYNYDYFSSDTFYKYFDNIITNIENYDFVVYKKIDNTILPSLYIHKDYIKYWHYLQNENVIKLPYIISKQPKLLESKIKNTNEIKVIEEAKGELIITILNEKEVLKTETLLLDTNLHQIKISQMNDSLLVIYSDSTHLYNGKLILENQNINLFSNITLDSTFVFTHTKLINNNVVLIGYEPQSNSTIAKVYIYNLQSQTLKEFEIPILKKIEDISVFNQNLIIAGETINMSGYVLFDKDFTNYKFINNNEYLGQVKKIHLKDNTIYLVCEKQNNTKYDINIIEDTLLDVLSVNKDIINQITNFLIYPNPSSDKISLDLVGVGVADLSIYDILGNEIMSIPNYTNKSEIDISNLSIGTYTIQIQTNTGSITKRLLVNR